MINNIFEYKLPLTATQTVHKFYITTPKEFKYITRISLIKFIDCSNGCPASNVSVISNGKAIINQLIDDFLLITNPEDFNSIKDSTLRINVLAKQNILEIIIDSNGSTYQAGDYFRLILWATNEPEQSYYFFGKHMIMPSGVNHIDEDFDIPKNFSLQKLGLLALNNHYDADFSVRVGNTLIINKVWSKIFCFKKTKNFKNKFEKIEIQGNKFALIFERNNLFSSQINIHLIFTYLKNDNIKQKSIKSKDKIFSK